MPKTVFTSPLKMYKAAPDGRLYNIIKGDFIIATFDTDTCLLSFNSLLTLTPSLYSDLTGLIDHLIKEYNE